MYVVTNTSKIRKDESYKLVNRFDKDGKIEAMEGFLGLEVMVTDKLKDYDEVTVVTKWKSERDFKKWVRSDAFKSSHKHGRPEYVIENKITYYEVKVVRKPLAAV